MVISSAVTIRSPGNHACGRQLLELFFPPRNQEQALLAAERSQEDARESVQGKTRANSWAECPKAARPTTDTAAGRTCAAATAPRLTYT